MEQFLRDHLEKVIPLTNAEFDFVLAQFTRQRFKKHQFLIQAGEPAKHAYFVVTGLLKLVYTDAAGKAHIVSFALEDWWESDFQAYYTQTPATLSLECLEDTEVFCLSLEAYHRLCAGLPQMAHFLLQKSILGSIAAQQRILSLLTTNARERYEQLVRQRPALLQRVSKALLASYLGVSRETLSRFSA
ncbi:Crp/Fnr family transcriptional regulator [Hymenobacter terrestris]|uniref:Crp/Fnr family transcriptional regulator n=1 Tax=Hymenobacter terrestris TaxID=2748310 RepID=A0ABX2Q5U1_9BACT|nr:Crp/Fnr family transcriptional regulator [Hymenobacter terrestris]NVO86330.1 Crp/Fnr family transcriptional regulator [Hymenobacter terrestris]